jgi:hypothetical protein
MQSPLPSILAAYRTFSLVAYPYYCSYTLYSLKINWLALTDW